MPSVTVNAIEFMMMLFLNLGDPCNAAPIEIVEVGEQTFIALTYVCGDKVFIVWHLKCTDRENIFGRPFWLQEIHSGYAFYINKFGEVLVGFKPRLDQMLIHGCGM